jgi:hypothetical protein
MRDLRPRLDAARRQYHAARYPGDLARDLLGADPGRRRRPWLSLGPSLLVATAALAALVTVILWIRHTNSDAQPQVAVTHPATPAPSTTTAPLAVPPWEHTLTTLQAVRYDTYLDGMKTSMRDAVSQLTFGVDDAIDSPLISTTARTVRHVADDLQEVASAVGAQLRPRVQ